MTTRRLYLDRAPGETRGVVTLDGRPERLLIERDGEAESQRLGAISTARVIRVEQGMATAFLQMPDGPDGVIALSGEAVNLTEGASIEVEVAAEARLDRNGSGKGLVARLVAESRGPPRLIAPAPPLERRLAAFAPGQPVVEGAEARDVADEAQDAVLAVTHDLPGGGSIAIEPTRALIAIDIDLGARGGSDPRRAARQVNLLAIAEAARLLRLKGLGGLIVLDLVGKGHDGQTLAEAAKAAFSPDGAGVSIGPISRFGLFELSIPHGSAPVADRLLDVEGRISLETAALDMLRAIERAGRDDPGGRILAYCTRALAEAAKHHMTALAARIGPRFTVETRDGMGRTAYEVSSR